MFTENNQTQRRGSKITGLERLGLRVSSMINHPVAQIRRWVTIHRLETETDGDWEEVMALLSETDGIDMIFHGDGSVTLRWEPIAAENRPVEISKALEAAAHF
ncbi:DUF1654 domain-containing protein [Pseudomonas fluorescens]|uniref:DUF1654 domain-containing protein n=1 Tax=Pseudomonas fluorescens TaxID=294 RepID=UPI0004BE3228|nr:DUF1654 domain-containing protein [Pseudomonas fluorescens]